MNKKHLFRFTLWAMPFNLVLLIIFSLFYFSNVSSPPQDLLTLIYLPLAFIGHFSIAVLAVFLLTLPLFLLPNNKLNLVIIVFLYTLLVAFLWIDTVVYQQYRFHINATVANFIINGGGDIFDFSIVTWLKFIFSILTVIIIQIIGVFTLIKFTKKKHPIGYLVFLFIFAITFIGQTIHAWAYDNRYIPVLSQTSILPFYYPLKSHELVVAFKLPKLDKKDLQDIKLSFSNDKLYYPKARLQCSKNTKTNILMIAIDTLRADMLASEIMPFSYELARKASKFNNHFSGGNGTRTGLFTLFYGLPGTYWSSFLQVEKGSVLIDVLNDNNYQFGIFSSARLVSPRFHRTIFVNVKNLKTHTKGNSPAEKDIKITNEFIDFIDNINDKQPFFAFLFYDSPHGYSRPKDFKVKFEPEWQKIDYFKLNNDYEPTEFFNRYKNSAYFVDGLIKKVITKLKREGLYDNTVILLTSDHGQEFNDNKLNYWGHGSNFTKYQLQVPLIFKQKNQANTKVINNKTSHWDIIPTLLQDVFNCKNPISDYSLGFNLFDEAKREFLISGIDTDYAIITDDLIAVDNNLGFLQIYDPRYRNTDKRIPRATFKKALDALTWFYAPKHLSK